MTRQCAPRGGHERTGQLGDPAAVPALLHAIGEPCDRFLEHAILYALIEIDDRPATLAGLADAHPNVRRRGAVVRAGPNGTWEIDAGLRPLLATDDRAVLRTLVENLCRTARRLGRRAWGRCGPWLADPRPSAERVAMTRREVSALITRPAMQKLVANALASHDTSKDVRLMLLEVIAVGESDTPPTVWNEGLHADLKSSDADVLRQAVMTVAALRDGAVSARLLEIGLEAGLPADLRIAAFCTAAKEKPALPDAGFAFLAGPLENPGPLRDRLGAAESLGRLALSPRQLEQTARMIAVCGPLEVSWLLRAFDGEASARTRGVC